MGDQIQLTKSRRSTKHPVVHRPELSLPARTLCRLSRVHSLGVNRRQREMPENERRLSSRDKPFFNRREDIQCQS